MRILVLSDSHGDVSSLCAAVERYPEAREIVFLGDGLSDIEQVREWYPDRNYHLVRGNCDLGAYGTPDEGLLTLGGAKILFTHGHLYGVKGGTDRLLARALERGADAALYGHTHIAKENYECDVHLFCPGSIGRGCFGAVDIEPSGIMTTVLHLY